MRVAFLGRQWVEQRRRVHRKYSAPASEASPALVRGDLRGRRDGAGPIAPSCPSRTRWRAASTATTTCCLRTTSSSWANWIFHVQHNLLALPGVRPERHRGASGAIRRRSISALAYLTSWAWTREASRRHRPPPPAGCATSNRRDVAAIAGLRAAELHGLGPLAEDIEDNAENQHAVPGPGAPPRRPRPTGRARPRRSSRCLTSRGRWPARSGCSQVAA